MFQHRVSKPVQTSIATFAFVHEEPGSNRDGNRRQIKAHVTRWQHRQARARKRKDIARQRHATNTDKPTSTTRGEVERESDLDYTATSTPDSIDWISRTGDYLNQHPTTLTQPGSKDSTVEFCIVPPGTLAQAFSRGEMSFRTLALHDTDNTMGANLYMLGLDLSSVMTLYKSMSKLQSADFRRQYRLKGTLQEARFYSFAHTDPTLLSMVVLLGIRNCLHVQGRPMEGRDFVAVVNLEQYLVASINSALAETDRGVSDQMLAAVALCAAYELKHGSPHRFHIHMEGLVRMIHLRGGLREIGRFDPYIPRFLTWIDVNTSKLSGSKGYLKDMSSCLAICECPIANTGIFKARCEQDFARVREVT